MTQLQAKSRWFTLQGLAEGITFGAVYGVFLRFGLGLATQSIHWIHAYSIMTVAFLVIGPIALGFLAVQRASRLGNVPVWQWIFIPWVSILIACAITLLLNLEGAICIVFLLPVGMFCATIGGVIAGLTARYNEKLSRNTAACLAILPFLLAPAESHITSPRETRTVASEILIHASPKTIWRNIERVPAISPSELQTSWVYRIGFPPPIEATLSYEGVGGVRHARFERGLLFIETVTTWQPEHRLAFTIKADTAHIPPTTLDEHVTIGGRYFDVLDGEYRLEPLANGDTLLHLTSHQRVSTDFNGYAGFWSDEVMGTIQNNILMVIKHRCEAIAAQNLVKPSNVLKTSNPQQPRG